MRKRGSQSEFINQHFRNDMKMYLGLAKVGISTLGQLFKYCGVNRVRARRHENSDYIKIRKIWVLGYVREVVILTEKGKNFCRVELGIKSFPLHNITHVSHDIGQAEGFYQFSQEQQKNYIHESAILTEHLEIERKTCIDGMVLMQLDQLWVMRENLINIQLLVKESCIDNLPGETIVMIAVETIGRSYSSKMIYAKMETAAQLKCTAIMKITY